MSLYETLKNTAIAHVQAFESPKPWDADAIWQLRTPDCVHYLHPTQSLPSAFSGPIYQEQHRAFMAFFGVIMETCKFDIKDLCVDVENRLVTVRLDATYDFIAFGDEPEEKNFQAEYVWITEMDTSGTKVSRVEEFLDVQRLVQYVRSKAERFAEFSKTQ